MADTITGGVGTDPTHATNTLYQVLVPFVRKGQYRNKIWLRWTIKYWSSSAHPAITMVDPQVCIGGTKLTSEASKVGSCMKLDSVFIDSKVGYVYSDGTINILHELTGINFNTKETTAAVSVLRLEVTSWADKERTHQIDQGGVGTLYELQIAPTQQMFVPVLPCDAEDVDHSEVGILALSIPTNGTQGAPAGKTPYFMIPEGYVGDAPRHAGVCLSLNLTSGAIQTATLKGPALTPGGKRVFKRFRQAEHATPSAMEMCQEKANEYNQEWHPRDGNPYKCKLKTNLTEVRECYLSGTPTYDKEVANANVWPINLQTAPGIKKLCAEHADDWKAYIHPIHTMKEGNCKACWGTKDAYLLDEFSHQAFTKAGWTSNFSNIKYSGVEFKLPLNPDQGDTGSNNVIFSAAKRTAMYKEELFALPDGIGTRIHTGGDMEITAPVGEIDPETGNVIDPWIKNINVFYQINAQISESLQYFRAWSKTCQFMASKVASEVMPYGTEGQQRLQDVNYSVKHLNSQQRDMFVKKLMRSSAQIGAGFDINDICHFKVNLSASMVEGESINDEYADESFESTTFALSCSFTFDELIAAAIYTGSDPVTQVRKFKDSLRIGIDLGSMGSSNRKLTEYETDENGSIIYNDDNKKLISGSASINDTKMWNSIGKFQSMSLDYKFSVINGFDIDVKSKLSTKGGVISYDSLKENMSVKVSGSTGLFSTKDKTRWSVGWKPDGSMSLSVTNSYSLKKPGPNNTSAFIDGGLICSKSASQTLTASEDGLLGARSIGGWTLSPSIKARGTIGGTQIKLLDGMDYSVNFKNGNASVGKAWKWTSKESWLNKEEGDKLEIDFSLRADQLLGQPNFRIGADLTFQKTLMTFDETFGKLVLSATGIAMFKNAPGGGGPFSDGGYTVGLGLNVSITWQNNALGWLGLPFNIHPRLSFGAACNLHFGGFTKGLEGQNAGKPVAAGVDTMQDGFRYTFVLGLIGYDISLVDEFRQHMEKKHNSVVAMIPFIGALSNCPVLNKLGPKESVWQYVIRSTPTRALVVAGEAAKMCDKKRMKKYAQFVQEETALNNALDSTVPVCPGPEYWDYTPGKVKHRQDSKNGRNSSKNNQCEPVFEKGDEDDQSTWTIERNSDGTQKFTGKCSTGYLWYNEKLYDLATEPYRTKSLNNWILGHNEIRDRHNKLRHPGVCVMSFDQVNQRAIARVQNEYDNSGEADRCKCMKARFKEMLTDQYYAHYWHGRSGVRDKFLKQLDDVGLGEGVLKLGIEAIDYLVLEYVQKNKDIINNNEHAAEFAEAMKSELTSILGSVGYGVGAVGSIDEKANHVDIDKIHKMINEQWGAATGAAGLLKYLHGCKGITSLIKDLSKFLMGGGKWLMGLLGGGSKSEMSDVDRKYTSDKVCGNLQRPFFSGGLPTGVGEGGGDQCYNEYTNWMYYLEAYSRTMHEFYDPLEKLRSDFVNSMSKDPKADWASKCEGHTGPDSVGYQQANADRLLKAFEILRANGLESTSYNYINVLTPTRGPFKGAALTSKEFLFACYDYIANASVRGDTWGGCHPDVVSGCNRAADMCAGEECTQESDYEAEEAFTDDADDSFQKQFFNHVAASMPPSYSHLSYEPFNLADEPSTGKPRTYNGLYAQSKVLRTLHSAAHTYATWVGRTLSRPDVGYSRLWSGSRTAHPGHSGGWTNWGAVLTDYNEFKTIFGDGDVKKMYSYYEAMDSFVPVYHSDKADAEFEMQMNGWLQEIHMVAGDFIRMEFLHAINSAKIISTILSEGWVIREPNGKWVVRDDIALGLLPQAKQTEQPFVDNIKDSNDVTDDFIKYVYNTFLGEYCDSSDQGLANAATSPSFNWLFQNGGVNFHGLIYTPDVSKRINPEGVHPERPDVKKIMLKLITQVDQAILVNHAHYRVHGPPHPTGGGLGYMRRFGSGSLTDEEHFSSLCRSWKFGSNASSASASNAECWIANIVTDAGGTINKDDIKKYMLGSSGSSPLAKTRTNISLYGEGQGARGSAIATTVGSHPAAKLTGRIPQGVSQLQAIEIRDKEIKINAGNPDGTVDESLISPL